MKTVSYGQSGTGLMTLKGTHGSSSKKIPEAALSEIITEASKAGHISNEACDSFQGHFRMTPQKILGPWSANVGSINQKSTHMKAWRKEAARQQAERLLHKSGLPSAGEPNIADLADLCSLLPGLTKKQTREEIVQKLEKLTPQDVKALAKELFIRGIKLVPDSQIDPCPKIMRAIGRELFSLLTEELMVRCKEGQFVHFNTTTLRKQGLQFPALWPDYTLCKVESFEVLPVNDYKSLTFRLKVLLIIAIDGPPQVFAFEPKTIDDLPVSCTYYTLFSSLLGKDISVGGANGKVTGVACLEPAQTSLSGIQNNASRPGAVVSIEGSEPLQFEAGGTADDVQTVAKEVIPKGYPIQRLMGNVLWIDYVRRNDVPYGHNNHLDPFNSWSSRSRLTPEIYTRIISDMTRRWDELTPVENLEMADLVLAMFKVYRQFQRYEVVVFPLMDLLAKMAQHQEEELASMADEALTQLMAMTAFQNQPGHFVTMSSF